MAYDENLAARIREALEDTPNVTEKNMFGGVCFMVNDKMCLGVLKDDMMCRIGLDHETEALEKPGCRPMDFTKRPMKGYVYVDQEGMKTKKQMQYWVDLCLDFNKTAKSSQKKKK
jgi:TfoX/Sxy family transcriptional regulator of competence genes